MYGYYYRKPNQLVVHGKKRPNLLSRLKDFEIQIYYTQTKEIITDIRISGIKSNLFDLDFKIGDNIQKAKDWVNRKGYVIFMDINKTL
jgi:hypothetical protein